MTEIEFTKYQSRGVGYHWQQASRSIKKRNLYVLARYQIVTRLIGDKIRGKSVLDVGCGDGVLSWMLAKRGAKVTGIDNAGDAVEFAREKCAGESDLDFRVGSVYELPFENDSFDYVVSSDVIEHLSEPDKMLSEMKRVWKEQGQVVISTPIKITGEPLDKMHFQEFFPQDFETLLRSQFSDRQIELLCTHPLFWQEFQQKSIRGHDFPRALINLANLTFGFNPFASTRGWRFFTLQTAVIGGAPESSGV